MAPRSSAGAPELTGSWLGTGVATARSGRKSQVATHAAFAVGCASQIARHVVARVSHFINPRFSTRNYAYFFSGGSGKANSPMRAHQPSNYAVCSCAKARCSVVIDYAWIAQHKAKWPIAIACGVLQVSASGYFEHRRHKPKQVKPSSRINVPTLLTQI